MESATRPRRCEQVRSVIAVTLAKMRNSRWFRDVWSTEMGMDK